MSKQYEFTLDEDDKKYLAEHLHESDQSRNEALKEIRNWLIEEKPDLHARLDDKYILPFLRGSKFNLEKTKTKLTNYYVMRRDRSEWFRNRDPTLPELQELVKLGVFVPLKLSSENRLVVIIRTAAHNPKKHKMEDVFKVGKMVLDVAAMTVERTQIYGIVAIFDMDGVGLAHALQLTPSMIKNAVHAWQNYHCKPKQLEFINAPVHVNVMMNVFKSFMSEKLRKRVKVHFKGTDGLYHNVDRSILPPEYGGDGDDMESLIGYWNRTLLSYREWFADDEQYKAE
ncbi:hypothetical protein NQ317_013356 [Molorchus minor]|uniref:CRAL-TRIO domain-containing protein n=1 Tax=Molorchus minor TaxID=1323400 RepID=A0ABQ9JL26_9CUCU|nr:hypothetical protein NQ317_013356 [Molorchus minor]